MSVMIDVERLGGIQLRDLQGKPVKVGSAWADRTAVLVFLRHFG